MAEAGHEIYVAFLAPGREAPELSGVVPFRLAAFGNHDPFLAQRIYALIRRTKPEIVQTWIPMMDIVAGVLSSIIRPAWICREPTSGCAYEDYSWKIRIRRSLVKRKAAAVIANSNVGRLYWLEHGLSDEKLFVVRNAIPIEQFAKIPPASVGNNDQELILYAGRLTASKNVDALIRAMAKVRQFRNAILLIAGEGPNEEKLEKLAVKLGLCNSVLFLGYLEGRVLWSYMKAAKIFASLSTYEGNPNCVIEAVACHLPLVVSDIPAHREFLNQESAILVPPNSEEDIVAGLLRALENGADSLGRAARAWDSIAGHSPARTAAQYLEIYERVLS
jgi:glycosyltransferase involved in cell wall biosynthesis